MLFRVIPPESRYGRFIRCTPSRSADTRRWRRAAGIMMKTGCPWARPSPECHFPGHGDD